MGTSFLYEIIIQRTNAVYIKISLQHCHKYVLA
jgi:hypothetical protein